MASFRNTLLRFFPVPKYLDTVYPAIDISQSSIKTIIPERRGGCLVPVHTAEHPLPDKCIVDGIVTDEHALVRALQAVIQNKKGASNLYERSVVTLPEEHAYIFVARIKGVSSAEIQIEVELAMSEHVPIPHEFILYTYEYVEHGLVAVVAYDARVSAEYERILSMAGIVPIAFVPHIVSSSRASHIPALGRSCIVVDMGRTRTSLALVYNGCVLASATVYNGSKKFLEHLAQTGLAIDDAMVALQTKGLDAHVGLAQVWDTYVQALLPYVDSWRTGVCNDTVAVAAPTQMFLCGGFAPIPGVVHAFARSCSIPTQAVNIWARLFSYEDFIPHVHERDSYRFASAAGLLLVNK